MARVLIIGCGYVGTALAKELAGAGHQVFGGSRSGRPSAAGVQPLRLDATLRDSLLVIPQNIEIVVYAVAASEHTEEGYHRAYVRGLRNVLSVLREICPAVQRVIFTSSTSVYGQDDGEWVDEESEAEPKTFSGRIMLEAEHTVLHSTIPSTVVRLSGIYGPGRTWMLEQVSEGKAACYFGAPRYTNRIHRDDCAGVLRHLVELETSEPIYLASDEEPSDRSELIRWLAAQLGAPEPKLLSPDHASQRTLSGNKRCRNSKLKDSGYAFRYPTFREGYRELCREFLKR